MMYKGKNKSYVKGGKNTGSVENRDDLDYYENDEVESYSPVEDEENGKLVIVISGSEKKSDKRRASGKVSKKKKK